MWHRQVTQHNLIGLHIDQRASVGLARTPTADFIRLSQAGHILRLTVHYCQTIEMTAIFRHDLGHKVGLPTRYKRKVFAEGRQATETRIDEPQPVLCKRQVVNVQIARKVSRPRQEQRVVLTGLSRYEVMASNEAFANRVISCCVASASLSGPTAKPIGLVNWRIIRWDCPSRQPNKANLPA